MEQALCEQQFSTVSIIAAEINTGLNDRMRVLEHVAKLITPAMMGDAAAMQAFIIRRARGVDVPGAIKSVSCYAACLKSCSQ